MTIPDLQNLQKHTKAPLLYAFEAFAGGGIRKIQAVKLSISHNPKSQSRRARLLAAISMMPPTRHEGLRRESDLYAFLISQGAQGYAEAAEVLLLAKYGCRSPLVADDRESRTWRGVAWHGGRAGSLLETPSLRRVAATPLQFL